QVAGHLVDNRYVGSRNSERFSMAQFALSEHEGHLRVATTYGQFWGSGDSASQSLVTILDVNSPDLEVTGEVGGLGQGERIYAVRFIGDRGYVVTFKKVDPLYVLDLSDPSDPVVAGELKIPGFSTYLHPMNDEYLIGLGFDADDQGPFAWTQGLKLALFDVSDPADPREVGHRVIGTRGTYSPAVEEHHAFTFDPQRMMIALPVELYEGGTGGSDRGSFVSSSVMLLQVDLSGSFDTLGEIILEEGGSSNYWGGWSPANVLRTIIIGDNQEDGVITLTTSGVTLHRIDDDMSEVGSI
ncbi:MAG: beta-propeller domain-containing protein, partial [Gammaproteobacteria bacterium]|nr:beta-propeller domain-containing protein [Gammaproteobacteria bacterium]